MDSMDLHGIDLNLLVAFDALMAERSVTKAAARVGRTQPAMSAALGRLRSLLGDDLFVRGPGGLQPTPRAIDLAEPLSQALAEIQRTLAFTQRFDPETSSASFGLALSYHPAALVLPRLMALLREVAPAVTLRVGSFDHRDDAVAILDTGQADIAIGVPPTVPPGGRILSRLLFTERFVCIMRKDHLAADRPLDLDAFLGLSHVLVSPENERFGVVDEALGARGLRRRLGLTLPHMFVAPSIVAQSDMIATVMAGVVDHCGQIDRLAIREPPLELPSPKFVMAWHRRNDAHPAQRWLRERIVGLFDEASGGTEMPGHRS